ncbi:hypothetical protein MAR_026494 [Mya arenaria]|uniref:Tyr recombinase domain-containing protein n=1 Tax=Mya arenaria TaxID=6604 RepID=A0ABY7ET77_MYAAR|nr:hypothetical protein MAR_026494 [Mya arenaria]
MYLGHTAGLRMGDKLMIFTQKPHKGVSRDTISRWVKTIMIKSGLKNKYGPHSTRAASTSTAKSAGVDLGTIIKSAGWTNAHTFAKFYDKEILSQKTVQEAVLSNLKILIMYLGHTAGLRMGDKLMIFTQKPHKGVSRDTISRWVKTIMIKSGLKNKYGPHSTRAASTSTAKSAGVDLGTIIKSAGWTNAHTFAKFYDKEILSQKTVQEAVLSNL